MSDRKKKRHSSTAKYALTDRVGWSRRSSLRTGSDRCSRSRAAEDRKDVQWVIGAKVRDRVVMIA